MRTSGGSSDDHHRLLSLGEDADRGGAEALGDQAVGGGGAAAALQVTEDDGARLLAGALLDLARHLLGDAAETHLAADLLRADGDDLAARRARALGDDDDREAAPEAPRAP